MPAFYLKCTSCGKEKRKILPKYDIVKCDCGEDMQRSDQTNLSTMVKETLDNGAMSRKVERIHNVTELMKERSTLPKDPELV